jgi:hypothetical protein
LKQSGKRIDDIARLFEVDWQKVSDALAFYQLYDTIEDCFFKLARSKHRSVIWSDGKVFAVKQFRNRQRDRFFMNEPPIVEKIVRSNEAKRQEDR